MNTSKMSFERAQGLVKGFLYSAVGFCIVGLIVNGTYPDLAVYAVGAAILFMVLALGVVFLCLKCPYCGKQIFVKCLTIKVCPHCKRNMVTGLKVKGKKGR